MIVHTRVAEPNGSSVYLVAAVREKGPASLSHELRAAR
jgi:hypothetical protein